MEVQRISFIVPAWNEEELLPKAIEAIHSAAREAKLSYQIVVADDASTDRTAELARAHNAEVVACDNRQIAATRNAGARASDGDLLFFIDADTQVTPVAVAAAVQAIEAGATYGGADITWEGFVPFWPRTMLRATLFFYRFFKLAPGAFFFCTREAFERVGGFDETIFCTEEYDLSKRLSKLGRYVWLKHQVITSGRKLRAYTMGELLRETSRMSIGGKKSLLSRDRLDLWTRASRASTTGHHPHVCSRVARAS